MLLVDVSRDSSVGNFFSVIFLWIGSPDIGFDADLACKGYRNKIFSDGCNGLKFVIPIGNFSY